MTIQAAPYEDHPTEYHTQILQRLFDHLIWYSDPYTPNGFLQVFAEWVVHEWSTRPYYRVERFRSDYELANFPVRTDFLLKEMQPIYRDFIHSYNGRHHFSPVAVNGSNCETLERELYDFFHESMRAEGINFLGRRYLELDGEDYWDKIFLEEFKEVEEIRLMDKLCQYFGFYGQAVEPYTCVPPEIDTLIPGLFAEWYLDDFKDAAKKSFVFDEDRNRIHALSPSHLYLDSEKLQ